MKEKKIKLIIDSELSHIPLIGMSINKLCSLVPLSDNDVYMVELCVIEAVTNCIKHAYKMQNGNDVIVTFSFDNEKLMLDVSDTGIAMDKDFFESIDNKPLQVCEDITCISEKGRGIALIKEIMDEVEYKTIGNTNSLTMVKYF